MVAVPPLAKALLQCHRNTVCIKMYLSRCKLYSQKKSGITVTLSIFEQDSDLGLCLSPVPLLLEVWWTAWDPGRMEDECRLRVEVVGWFSPVDLVFILSLAVLIRSSMAL